MNRLHVYTGEGKGKTTAAMGLALRSLGHDRRVLIAQFLKNGNSGEVCMLAGFEQARVVTVPVAGFTFNMTPEQLENTKREQTAHARRLMQIMDEWKPQLIVLDELCVALACGLVDEQTGRALVDAALAAGETVATGRNAPAWLTDRADYVSRIEAQKHPFETEGLAAREGIEW